jgi:hypothetical protein
MCRRDKATFLGYFLLGPCTALGACTMGSTLLFPELAPQNVGQWEGTGPESRSCRAMCVGSHFWESQRSGNFYATSDDVPSNLVLITQCFQCNTQSHQLRKLNGTVTQQLQCPDTTSGSSPLLAKAPGQLSLLLWSRSHSRSYISCSPSAHQVHFEQHSN